MNGRGVSRSAVLLLLGFGLLLGLMAMHGMSASPSPLHVSEPVLATHHGMAATGDPVTHAPAAHGGDVSGHLSGCESGTVCFALLGGILLLALALPRPTGLLPLPIPALRGRETRRGPPKRPPDLYSLAVLRL